MKWYKFKPGKPANRQKLPTEKTWVLVELKNDDPAFLNPIVVGYLKYSAGIKSAPYFITPGATIEQSPIGPERTVAWCDCLPDNFEWPKVKK